MTFSNNCGGARADLAHNTLNENEMVLCIVSANVRNKMPFNAISADSMEIEKFADFASRNSNRDVSVYYIVLLVAFYQESVTTPPTTIQNAALSESF